MEDRVTSVRVLRHLQELHKAPEWASWAELANGTGSHKSRSIDLFALNCYPSKRFMAVAYEIKVSRADFRRELDDPTKRAPWEAVAMETWFAAPAGVIPAAEVPDGWGLIELRDTGTWARTIRARQREQPTSWPVEFVAAVARRASDPAPEPLAAYEVLGRKVTIEHLKRLAMALHGRDRRSYQDAKAAHDELEQGRVVRRKHTQELALLRDEVSRLCGYHSANAEGFRRWVAAKAATSGLEAHHIQSLRLARQQLGRVLSSLGVPIEDPK